MQSPARRGKHPMRSVGEFCALLWGPSKPKPLPPHPVPSQSSPQPHSTIPVIAARTKVEEVILPADAAQAQGLPPGAVLRRTTIDEIRYPEISTPSAESGKNWSGPQGPRNPY